MKSLVLLALMAFGALMVLGLWKTLHPMSREEARDILREALDGTVDWYTWDYFTCISLRHDPLLESIQIDCNVLMQDEYLSDAAGGHIFNEKGLREIRNLLEMLEQAER